MKLSMEELVEFLQVTLSKDFFCEDDFVIEQLQASMTELRRAKLELPAPGTSAPNNPFSINYQKVCSSQVNQSPVGFKLVLESDKSSSMHKQFQKPHLQLPF